MTFKIDGVDYSSKIDVNEYTVVPRKVIGGAAGYLIDGSHVADLVTVKKDLKIKFMATEQSDTSSISAACIKEYVTLQFVDPIANVSLEAVYEPTLESLHMAIDTDEQGKTYWYGFNVSFMQK